MSYTARCSLLVLVTAALPRGLTAQAEVPGPSFERVISLASAGSPAISPDGRTIAYTVRTADWKQNRFDTEIWLARESEAPFQLTRTPDGSSTSPSWSPDGQFVAFLADRGDKQQIHLIRAAGGEAWTLTDVAEGVHDFAWAPDGRRIAFTRSEPESDADKKRKERYGDFAVEDADYRQRHLWLIPASREAGDTAPTPTRLTDDSTFTVRNFAWSPDGSRLAVELTPDPLINSRMHADVSLLDVTTRTLRPLIRTPGYDGRPIWSPDGRWVLFRSDDGDTTSNYYRNGKLFTVPASGGERRRLAADLDENVGDIAWTPTGIYVVAWRNAKRHVFRVDPNGGPTRLFADSPPVIGAIAFTPDGRTVALSGASPTTLTEIYRATAARYRPVAVTAMTDQIADWTLGASEMIAWTSQDGARIEGVLHTPRDFDPRRRYPLFVEIHGGPTGIDVPTPVTGYVYPVLQWLAKGALVLRPNYRGSAGYGEAFRALNVRNLGVGDAWDVLSGVDHLVAQGFVDTTRMGAMGWSQGGYISAFLTTTTRRFAAISVGAGISNWTTYYVNTDIHPFTRQYLQATPWDDPDIYATTSPMTYIRRAATPTLIQHGEFDRRVPIPNAYELHQGLQDQGVPTQLIVYKGFGHGITKPKEQLAAMWHNWQWFAKYLWGEDVALPLADAGGRP